MCAVQALEGMVAACLKKDADKRPTATQLLKDPVLKHGHDHKWLAKRLSGLDKSSRRALSAGDDSTAYNSSYSAHSTSSVIIVLGLTDSVSAWHQRLQGCPCYHALKYMLPLVICSLSLP